MLTKIARTNAIKSKAQELGFTACGIAEAGYLEKEANMVKQWLKNERQGKMQYMANHFEKRTDPSKLLPEARSVIVLLYNYAPPQTLQSTGNYKISKYAYGKDYHFVIKRKLNALIAFLEQFQNEQVVARAFVDSAPVLERSWAQKAGLGWIGKNTCLITKLQGSYFFIGEVITKMEFDYNQNTVPNHCGGCTRCIDACPTQALDMEGLDASKCISYLTIEYKGDNLPQAFKGKMDDWIFGCDICQEVCPWNRLAEAHEEPEFNASPELIEMDKSQWEKMEQEKFNSLFKNSPVKRTKFAGLKRNINFVVNNAD